MNYEKIYCPNCKEEHAVYSRPHWSKTNHEFACGKCKLELIFKRDHCMSEQKQINYVFSQFVKFEIEDHMKDIEEKIKNMTQEEQIARLNELNKKLKKN